MATQRFFDDVVLNMFASRLAKRCDYIVATDQKVADEVQYLAIKIFPNVTLIPGITTPTFRRQVVDIIGQTWVEWMLKKSIVTQAGVDRIQVKGVYVFTTQGGP